MKKAISCLSLLFLLISGNLLYADENFVEEIDQKPYHLVRHIAGRQPANQLPDPTLWLRAVLYERSRAKGRANRRHI